MLEICFFPRGVHLKPSQLKRLLFFSSACGGFVLEDWGWKLEFERGWGRGATILIFNKDKGIVANANCSNVMPRNFASVQPFYRVLYSFRSFHLFVCLKGLAETSFKVYVMKRAGFEKTFITGTTTITSISDIGIQFPPSNKNVSITFFFYHSHRTYTLPSPCGVTPTYPRVIFPSPPPFSPISLFFFLLGMAPLHFLL